MMGSDKDPSEKDVEMVLEEKKEEEEIGQVFMECFNSQSSSTQPSQSQSIPVYDDDFKYWGEPYDFKTKSQQMRDKIEWLKDI